MSSSSHRLSRVFRAAVFAAAAVAAMAPAQAAVLTTQAQSLGGTQWQLDFSITHDGTPASFEGVTLYFDRALFANLGDAVAPTGWDPMLFQPDAGLGSDGAYDVLADAAHLLSAGQTASGFSLRFDFLGNVLPTTWSYDLYRLDATSGDIEILDSGRTVEAVAAVPLPATLALTLLGLSLMPGIRRGATLRVQEAA